MKNPFETPEGLAIMHTFKEVMKEQAIPPESMRKEREPYPKEVKRGANFWLTNNTHHKV